MYFCLEPKVSCGPVMDVIGPRPGANLRLIYVTVGAVTDMVYPSHVQRFFSGRKEESDTLEHQYTVKSLSSD